VNSDEEKEYLLTLARNVVELKQQISRCNEELAAASAELAKYNTTVALMVDGIGWSVGTQTKKTYKYNLEVLAARYPKYYDRCTVTTAKAPELARLIEAGLIDEAVRTTKESDPFPVVRKVLEETDETAPQNA